MIPSSDLERLAAGVGEGEKEVLIVKSRVLTELDCHDNYTNIVHQEKTCDKLLVSAKNNPSRKPPALEHQTPGVGDGTDLDGLEGEQKNQVNSLRSNESRDNLHTVDGNSKHQGEMNGELNSSDRELSDLERLVVAGLGDQIEWTDLDQGQLNKVSKVRSSVLPELDFQSIYEHAVYMEKKYGELSLPEKNTLWQTLSDLERLEAGVDHTKNWGDLNDGQKNKVVTLRYKVLPDDDLLIVDGNFDDQGKKYGELSLSAKNHLFVSKKDKIKPVYLSQAEYDGLLRYRRAGQPAQSGAWVVLSPEEKEVVDNKFKFLSKEQRKALWRHKGKEDEHVHNSGYEEVTKEEWEWLMRTTRGVHDNRDLPCNCDLPCSSESLNKLQNYVPSFGTMACILILVVHLLVVVISWLAFNNASEYDTCMALTITATSEINGSNVTTTAYSPLVNETEYKYCEEDNYEHHMSLDRNNSLVASVMGTGVQTLTATTVKVLADDVVFIERHFSSLYWGTKMETLLIVCILLSSLFFWCNMAVSTFILRIHTTEFLQIVGGTVIAAPFAGPFLIKLYNSCVSISHTCFPVYAKKEKSKPAAAKEKEEEKVEVNFSLKINKGETKEKEEAKKEEATDIENQTGKT